MDSPRGFGRTVTMRARINAVEQQAFNDAAKLRGLTRSSWVRMVLRQAAAADLHAAGRKVEL